MSDFRDVPPPPPPPPPSWAAVPDEPARDAARSQVRLPAIGLIVVGVGSFLIALGLLVLVLLGWNDDLVEQAVLQQPGQREMMELVYGDATFAVSGVLGALLSVFVVAGGIRMLLLRSYGLSMTAAIFALVLSFCSCCCLVSLPVGIWSIVVLARYEVKAAFTP